MGAEQQLRMKKVQHKFKLRGLNLTLDAVRAVAAHVEESGEDDDAALDRILAETDRVTLSSPMVTKDAVVRLLAAVSGGGGAEPERRFVVVDAFAVPRFAYDAVGKTFFRRAERPLAHAEAEDKAALYRDRFELVQQRVARDKHFARPALGPRDGGGGGEMRPLETLVGSAGRQWVMGTVARGDDGRLCLEDPTAAVPIDISAADVTTGFFTENSVVVAEGALRPSDGVFEVATLGLPPLESRASSLAATSGLDFFGAGVVAADELARLEVLEKRAVDDMFVILAEVWLDDEETLEKVSRMLTGYEQVDVVPSLFVFMGNFCSHPCNLAFSRFADLRAGFARLGAMVAACPRLAGASRFLFVPGPEDLGPANVLPRPPLLKYFAEEILKSVPAAEFGTNPCRISFYSQEIVLFREDLIHRMRRSCIVPPSEDETRDPFEHLVATVAHQSHLCPLPLTVQPISWAYDHSLRLYPTPHALVLADRLEQKVFRYAGVTSFSPGSFSSDGAFVAYRPALREPELSSV